MSAFWWLPRDRNRHQAGLLGGEPERIKAAKSCHGSAANQPGPSVAPSEKQGPVAMRLAALGPQENSTQQVLETPLQTEKPRTRKLKVTQLLHTAASADAGHSDCRAGL